MILYRNSYREDEKLFSTGDSKLDDLLTEVYYSGIEDGYDYAQKEFALNAQQVARYKRLYGDLTEKELNKIHKLRSKAAKKLRKVRKADLVDVRFNNGQEIYRSNNKKFLDHVEQVAREDLQNDVKKAEEHLSKQVGVEERTKAKERLKRAQENLEQNGGIKRTSGHTISGEEKIHIKRDRETRQPIETLEEATKREREETTKRIKNRGAGDVGLNVRESFREKEGKQAREDLAKGIDSVLSKKPRKS